MYSFKDVSSNSALLLYPCFHLLSFKSFIHKLPMANVALWCSNYNRLMLPQLPFYVLPGLFILIMLVVCFI